MPWFETTVLASGITRFTEPHVHGFFRSSVTALPAPNWTIADYGLTPAPLTEFLDEGDVVDLGNRKFTVLHLPGHWRPIFARWTGWCRLMWARSTPDMAW